MFLTDLSIKRPVVASVMSLVLVIFGLVTFQEIPTDELPDVQPPVVTIQTEYRGASAEIVDTQITQKIEDFVAGTPGLETVDSFSEDESSRITLTFETDLDLDDVANDVRSSVSRVLDNLPDGAGQPEIFKQSAGMRTTMWLSFNSEIMTDLELTDYADRYLTDVFSTVNGVGRVRLGGERELSLRVWLDPIALAARDLTTQEVEEVLKKDYIEAAKSRGINNARVLFKHALPNTLLPILTITGLTVSSLVGGALLIEITFSWPGIALGLQEALNQRDYPVVQGIVVIISSLVVMISIGIDIAIAYIDPRVSY